MSKTEQCKALINKIVNECDNERWITVTLAFLAGLYNKRAVYNRGKVVLVEKGGVK